MIGVLVDQAAHIKLPFPVKIDAGSIGGPSAGLAFALEVVEKLGRDVDRGYKVAATGEIELDGSVGPIGGVEAEDYRRAPARTWTSSLCLLGITRKTPASTRGRSGSSLWRVFDRRCARWQRCRRSTKNRCIIGGFDSAAKSSFFVPRAP